MPRENIARFLRLGLFPHIFCAGCGHGIAFHALIRAFDALGYNPEEVMVVSGIGCSSRIPGYINANTLHTTHGRALAFATGIKLAKPHLRVVTVMGDGDCAAIGGNHFIHAARRNIDITAIVLNNYIYGMTGGQASPTTPHGARGSTAPYGFIERQFDLCNLAVAAGAVYVARATVFHISQMESFIKKALQKRGFSFVEIISTCPTQFGRRNRLRGAVEMMEWLKNNSVPLSKAKEMSDEELEGKIVIGEFADKEMIEYTELYHSLCKAAIGEGMSK
ncbi:MAG: 2-oxoacid:ferredoxin oxidoreductase subunit beta [Synergistetes bacterium]|nr:MAG: Thiamine pyrophosphate TPP-binding domain-containing protein [bacterium 42_11]MBC7331986.1 2-oxoacid:ferredoxin oxidoreductase subunit beta [Synergistota bacterium]MDK2870825.1 2-oxoglutarate/2-oxoacid ferredoxin oxidoreductase subunit beta [bacterium]